jgi:hypothetical protein
VILRLDNMQRLSPRAFHEHAFATRVYVQQVPAPNGGVKIVEKSAPKEWLKWPHRSTVQAFTYKPGAERVTASNDLNTWHGWGCTPAKGTVAPWVELLDYLFQHADTPPA